MGIKIIAPKIQSDENYRTDGNQYLKDPCMQGMQAQMKKTFYMFFTETVSVLLFLKAYRRIKEWQ